MAPTTGKRVALSIETKLKILKEVKDNVRSRCEIAKAFEIPKSSLSTIVKNRDKILAASNSGLSGKRSRTTEAKHPKMEKAVLEWLKAMRHKNMPVDGNVLKVKADVLAMRLNIEGFKASDGWLQRFKLRHGLSFRKLCGESASVDLQATDAWNKGKLQRLLNDYDPQDVFNADETGLFFKLLPDRSLVFKDETCNGGKRAKQRLTIMLAANMTGTEKLVPFVIGKAQKPRCFKGIRTLPVKYKANQKAWMTGAFYEEWLREWDRKMSLQKRKVLLIVDNCTAQQEVDGVRAVRVEFLPPNATSVIQPLDQGIIQSFKKHYRSMLLHRVILNLEQDKVYSIDVLGAIHLTVAAWGKVTEATIANCFRHAGFVKSSAAPSSAVVSPDSEPPTPGAATERHSDDSDGENLLRSLSERLPAITVNFQEYADVDAAVQCSEDLTEKDIEDRAIRAATIDENVLESEESSSEDDESGAELPPAMPRPTVHKAAEYVMGLRRFFEGEANAEVFLEMMAKAEEHIFQVSLGRLKQRNIQDYFK